MTLQPFPWLVQGFIAEGFNHLLVGRPHKGKSWFAAQLAVCVASGEEFLNEFPVRPGSVILIDEDTPTTVLEWRLGVLSSFYERDLSSLPLDYRSMRGFQLDDVGDVSALTQDIARLSPPVLVIIDCLDSALGRLDTNKTPDARKVGLILNSLKAKGATLLVLHHMSLKGEDDARIYESDADFTKWIMGNTKLVASSDTVFGMWGVTEQPRTVFAVRVKPRRMSLNVPERFAIELLDFKDQVLLCFRPDVPKAPSELAKIIFHLFHVNPTQPFTVREVEQQTGNVLSGSDTRIALKELAGNCVLLMGREKHNLHRYRVDPGFATLKTDYADALRAVVQNP